MTTKAKHYYQHKEVEVVRAAKAGDAGFDPHAGAQSLIELEDGTRRAVPDTDVLDDAKSNPKGGAHPAAPTPPTAPTPTPTIDVTGRPVGQAGVGRAGGPLDDSAGGSPPDTAVGDPDWRGASEPSPDALADEGVVAHNQRVAEDRATRRK